MVFLLQAARDIPLLHASFNAAAEAEQNLLVFHAIGLCFYLKLIGSTWGYSDSS